MLAENFLSEFTCKRKPTSELHPAVPMITSECPEVKELRLTKHSAVKSVVLSCKNLNVVVSPIVK